MEVGFSATITRNSLPSNRINRSSSTTSAMWRQPLPTTQRKTLCFGQARADSPSLLFGAYSFPCLFASTLGGATDMSLGGIFSTRNGNNPANINFHLDLQSALLLSYRLPIPSCPILATLTWRASLLGSTFVTDFGESYYENFMLQDVKHGFLDGLHFSHLGKSHRQELEFALDIPLPWIMTLRIGYRLSEHDQRINFLRSSHLSNSFFFGVVKELWSTSGRDAERGKTADTIF